LSNEYISNLTEPRTVTYSINGDTLTQTWQGETTTYSRISRNTDIVKVVGGNRNVGSSRASNSQQSLVGRWEEVSRGWKMDFLSDGTGIVDGQPITWKIEGNRLYIIGVSAFSDVFGDNGSCEYTLSASSLILRYSGTTETYTRR
jgi:hypothetical protein